MALTISYRFTHNGVVLDNFFCYKFKYLNYENDPYPHVLALYRIKGTHPSSGNFWNLWQCINLNYIPRNQRKIFVNDTMDILKRSRSNFKFTWSLLTKKYPYLKIATRRYYLNPANYIQNLEYIPPESMDKEITRNMVREYTMKALRARGKKLRLRHPKPGKK